MKRLTRREVLEALSVTGAAFTLGCGSSTPTSPTATAAASTAATTTTGTSTAGACVVSPNETLGPYPSLADFIRSDIREGKSGTTLTLTLTVVNASAGCAALAGAMVEIWQCDAEGHYSQYSQGGYNGTAQTFLRGIQTTDASGRVTFTTVYPGWYQGRATHIHIEVTMNGRSVKATQIAFPESVNASVYRSGVYASRGSNPTANLSDGIFSDSLSSELATVTGDPASGYAASYTVGVAV